VLLQVEGDSLTLKTPFEVGAKENKKLTQMFDITLVKGSYYKIVNVGTTQALTASASGAKAIEYKYKGYDSQLWTASLNDDGTVTFINVKKNLALDLANGNAASGTKAKLTEVSPSSSTQKWVLSPTTTGLSPVHRKGLVEASKFKSETDTTIEIDLTNHELMVFKHDIDANGAWKLDDSWRISCGYSRGTYVWAHGRKTRFRYTNPESKGYSAYYWSRMGNPPGSDTKQYMHSIIYSPGTHSVADGRLGRNISLGCVRMSLSNAKYVYYGIDEYSRVQRYY